MINNMPRFGKHQVELSKTSEISSKDARAALPVAAAKTVKGQKYVSPLGRHSRQTHRRAEERATAAGFTTEKEQHADDRAAVETEISRSEQQKLNQRAQNTRGAAPKA